MTITRFLNHLSYVGTTCPVGMNPSRWSGMLVWYNTRLGLGESFIISQV